MDVFVRNAWLVPLLPLLGGLAAAIGARQLKQMAHLPVIAVDFPKFGDGRGFSTARLLRERYGFAGELRAVGDIFRDVSTECEFGEAAQALWRGLTRGDQRRSVRMLLQVLSLATTDPDTYSLYARTAVDVMLDPISDALVSVGYSGADARVRATLIVSGLRGLCQDLLVTGQRSRVDAAAELLIRTAVE